MGGGDIGVGIYVYALLLSMLRSSFLDGSIVMVCVEFQYSCVRLVLRFDFIWFTSRRASALAFAIRYILSLYLVCLLSCIVCVCGSVAIFGV